MIRFRRTILPWAATVLVLVLCLIPKKYIPFREVTPEYFGVSHVDKLAHFAMFSAFALCWAGAGRSLKPSRSRAAVVLAAALVLTVGTELAQGIPRLERDPDTLDALADAAGSLAGVGIVAVCGAGGVTPVRAEGEPEG